MCKSIGEELQCSIIFRSLLYVLVALFCIGWSAWDRVCVFFNKRPCPFSFDIISLSVPLLVGLGSFYHA